MDGAFAAGAVSATKPQEAAVENKYIYHDPNNVFLSSSHPSYRYFHVYNAATGQDYRVTGMSDEPIKRLKKSEVIIPLNKLIILVMHERKYCLPDILAHAKMLGLDEREMSLLNRRMVELKIPVARPAPLVEISPDDPF